MVCLYEEGYIRHIQCLVSSLLAKVEDIGLTRCCYYAGQQVTISRMARYLSSSTLERFDFFKVSIQESSLALSESW